MRKTLLLGLLTACLQANIEAFPTAVDSLIYAQNSISSSTVSCPPCPICPRGPEGKKGERGPRGSRGPRGATGPSLEINDMIEVSLAETVGLEQNELVSFDLPLYAISGIDIPSVGGMQLIESTIGSGEFDTVVLPAQAQDTYYSVTFGASLSFETLPADFQLVLNGTPLPYTDIGINAGHVIQSRTSIVLNPANVWGRLQVVALRAEGTTIEPLVLGGISTYLTVVKLSNEGSY